MGMQSRMARIRRNEAAEASAEQAHPSEEARNVSKDVAHEVERVGVRLVGVSPDKTVIQRTVRSVAKRIGGKRAKGERSEERRRDREGTRGCAHRGLGRRLRWGRRAPLSAWSCPCWPIRSVARAAAPTDDRAVLRSSHCHHWQTALALVVPIAAPIPLERTN